MYISGGSPPGPNQQNIKAVGLAGVNGAVQGWLSDMGMDVIVVSTTVKGIQRS